jgi:hypothetical protein
LETEGKPMTDAQTMREATALLAAIGYGARFVDADADPLTAGQCDDEIRLTYLGIDTGWSLQLCGYGRVALNEYGGEGDDFWMTDHGVYRTVAAATRAAIKLIKAGGSK